MGKSDIRSEEIQLQGLLDSFLNTRVSSNGQDSHIDEDLVTAFVEGTLTEREAGPVVTHLADCSFCRHVTAELVKLEYAFADVPQSATVADAPPSKVSEVLNGLLARIFGNGESAVFAHQESEDDAADDKCDADSEDKR